MTCEHRHGDQNARKGFVRFRRLFILLPFASPLAVLICATLAMKGVSYALYTLCVASIVWLASCCVRTYNEYRVAGSGGVGGIKMSLALHREVTNAVHEGMEPDVAVGSLLGFAVGSCISHFHWSPEDVASVTWKAAVDFSEKMGKGQSEPE